MQKLSFFLGCTAIEMVLNLAAPTRAAAQASQDPAERALGIISDTADRICQSVPIEQTNQGLTLTGDARAKLGGAIGQIADLGIKGAGEYKSARSMGVLQQDLAVTIQKGNDCKLSVFKDLTARLLPPGKSKFEIEKAEPNPTSMARSVSQGEIAMSNGKSVYLTKDNIVFSMIRTPTNGRSDLVAVRINGGKPSALGLGETIEFEYSGGSCVITVIEIKYQEGKSDFFMKCT